MSFLICYDITANPLRARLGKKILAFGFDRINKSVYLGTVKGPVMAQLEQWLRDEMAQKAEPGDSLVVLPVSAYQINDMRVYGKDDLDRDELTGSKNSLYF